MKPLHLKATVYRKTRMLPASMTVFASLSLMLVASFLLMLLEAARVRGLETYSRMQRVNAMMCVGSEYERALFEQYGLFLLDASYGKAGLQPSEINARLLRYSQENLRPLLPLQNIRDTQNFYQMDVTEATLTNYLLATDYDGMPFQEMAVRSIKERYPLELAKEIYAGLSQTNQAMSQAQASQNALSSAQENLEQAKAEQAAQASAQTSQVMPEAAPASEAPEENPMDLIKEWKKADLLTLVLPKGKRVSAKTTGTHRRLEQRTRIHGTMSYEKKKNWYDSVLYQKFLNLHFTCYVSEAKAMASEPLQTGDATQERTSGNDTDTSLRYEQEYIVGGKSSDRENLKSVVQQILLMREGANYLYLQTDATKKQEAYALATSIAAATGTAPAISLIAQGILAVWAFAESVLDVRTLLAGGKIAWMKTMDTWTSDLYGLGALVSGELQAKTQPTGEDYQGYLNKLLYLKSDRIKNYRTMDLLEMSQQSNGRGICMDTMMLAWEAAFVYETEPLFTELMTIGKPQVKGWKFEGTENYWYVTRE